jgi:hypothetical protein
MNQRWLYAVRPDGEGPTWLIDLKADADQKRNVARAHPAVCGRMDRALERWSPADFEGDVRA